MPSGNMKRIMGFIMAVVIGACLISNVYLLVQPSVRVLPKIGTILNIIGLASASLYCMNGYRKDARIYYKVFFTMYTFHVLTGTYGMVVDFKGSVMAAAWVLAFEVTFANLLLLIVPDNLGERKSKTIGAINVCIWAGFLIHHFIFKSHTIGIYTIRIISYLVSAVLTAILIYAKYEDKKERRNRP